MILLLIVLLMSFTIALVNIFPVLFSDNVVQDDFRQSFFWVWKFWDHTLLQNAFLTDIYQSHLIRTPIVNLIYHIAPFLTDNLIFFSKVLAILIATVSGLFAYLYFYQLTKNKILSFIFTFFMSNIFWYTDHVSNACTRCYLWVGIYAYLYFKEKGKDYLASLVCFILLFLSPFTFLICLGMEFVGIVLKINFKQIISSLKENRFKLLALILNIASMAFLYLVLFKDVKTMAKGKTFLLDELKSLPEFNPGGRHPIFDVSNNYLSWFKSLHWGLPLGGFNIEDKIILIAIFLTIILCLYLSKSRITKLLKSNTMTLFYSSVMLYILALITFPLLYFPNRYIEIPWLLLLLLLPFLFFNQLINFFRKTNLKLENISYFVILVICVLSLHLSQKLRQPGFLSMTPKIKEQIEKLPKDFVIAAHPALHDITMVDAVAKRAAFVDRERSVAYSKEVLLEIRRRTIESFKIVYATDKKEVLELMKKNNINALLVHKHYYSDKYLENPKYYEPYNQTLKLIISSNKPKGFFLNELLKKKKKSYILLTVEEIEAS